MTRALPSTDTSPIITICDQVRPPARKHLVGYTTSNSASGTDRGVLHGKQHSPRHADGAVSQSLDYGGITGTKMGRAAAWPASKKSKTHDAPRPASRCQLPRADRDASTGSAESQAARSRRPGRRQPGARGRCWSRRWPRNGCKDPANVSENVCARAGAPGDGYRHDARPEGCRAWRPQVCVPKAWQKSPVKEACRGKKRTDTD